MAGKVIRVGIAGQGRSGFDIHAKWLREAPRQYRIVAVSDEMAERRAQAKRELGCRAHTSWQDMIDSGGIDLFVNALPSPLHPKGTIQALQARLHVVCEKPLAVKVKDFDRMVAAAKASRRVLAPFQNSRFHPFFVKIQQIIASGVLGEIIHTRLSYAGFSRRWDWQTRQDQWGGSLNNSGPHPMDHAVMLFGNKTPKVFSRLVSGPNSSGDADDFALAVLHGPGSPTIEVYVSSYHAWAEDQYVVNGTCGGLTGGMKGLKWRYFHPDKSPQPKRLAGWSVNREFCSEKLSWTKRSWTAPKSNLDAFQLASKRFYDNVYDVLVNKGRLVVTHAQVRRQIAVIEKCHQQNRLPTLGAKSSGK